MGYDVQFDVAPPVAPEVFNDWHDALGDEAPIAFTDDGASIGMSGSYGGTGRYLTDYWPKLRAWAEAYGVRLIFDWGDYCPEGFDAKNKSDEA